MASAQKDVPAAAGMLGVVSRTVIFFFLLLLFCVDLISNSSVSEFLSVSGV